MPKSFTPIEYSIIIRFAKITCIILIILVIIALIISSKISAKQDVNLSNTKTTDASKFKQSNARKVNFFTTYDNDTPLNISAKSSLNQDNEIFLNQISGQLKLQGNQLIKFFSPTGILHTRQHVLKLEQNIKILFNSSTLHTSSLLYEFTKNILYTNTPTIIMGNIYLLSLENFVANTKLQTISANGNINGQYYIDGKDNCIYYKGRKLDLDHQKKQLILSNKVSIVHQKTRLDAGKLIYDYNSNLITLHNKVTIQDERQNISANKAIYNISTKTIVFTGNVFVKNSNGVLACDSFIYNTLTKMGHMSEQKFRTKLTIKQHATK